jgi:hypothetical protein
LPEKRGSEGGEAEREGDVSTEGGQFERGHVVMRV